MPPSEQLTSSRGLAKLGSPRVFLPVILALFAIFRIIQVLGGKVHTSHDSGVYAPRLDPLLNHGPLVSFLGHAPRPWGLPLFYAMFADDHSRAVAQWVVATIAWAFLAFELASHMRNAAAKALAALGITGLALTTNVASWDFAILTESMSMSIGVALVASFLRWRRLNSWGWLAVMTALAVWWTFLRPDIRVFTALLIGLLALLAWRERRTAAPRARAAAGAGLVLILAIGWYAMITPAMNEAFKPYDGDAPTSGALPPSQYFFVHRLRTVTLTDPQTEAVFRAKLGMPSCAAVDAFAGRPDWATVEFSDAFLSCPQLQAWASEHDYDFWGSFAKAAPVDAAKKFYELGSMTLGGDAYAQIPRVVPGQVEKLVYPSQKHGLPIALITFLVAGALALWANARRVHALLLTTAVTLFGAALLSSAATVLMGTGEYRRFGMQELVATKLAVIILLACAVDGWLLRRRQAQPTAYNEVTSTR